MKLHSLISVLLLFVTLIPKGKTGVIPGQKQCIVLKGVCRDKGCSTLDDTIGTCNEEKKCCRRWWILEPYPTPVPKGKSP
ncbi:beta-defensin 130B [Macaca nemestrina]|uniref:Beta-defensin-like domain-containing protein n=5 Tax=Cercopithecinae TaxID=9528 RepID=A0A2K5LX56_CERAT|nr:beta-defensin 130 [Papio anubis]XP_024651636.1 beta-defensin 130 [Macaca nemestrina]XP_025250842.1 beta-defensin 130B [Theropithecus gelada]XP_050657098.1 beta-defensin 130B [Macaca thibetana thibetana]